MTEFVVEDHKYRLVVVCVGVLQYNDVVLFIDLL